MSKINISYLVLTVLILAGCNIFGSNHSKSDVTLKETVWKLINFQDENGQKSESGSSEITLIFQKDSIVSGSSSSNSYSGSYNSNGGNLDIESVITTEVAEPDGSKYMIYLSSLNGVQSYEFSSGKLILHYREQDKALIFEAIVLEE